MKQLLRPFELEVSHSTITNNRATSGGGLYSTGIASEIDTTLTHTIVSGNFSATGGANNLGGTIEAASSYNLIGPGATITLTGPGNVQNPNNNPRLASLADYGGPTRTHALLSLDSNGPASPAINAGNPLALPGIAGVPMFDQRGDSFTRIVDGQIDIGAFERGAVRVINVTISGTTSVHQPFAFNNTQNDLTDRDGSGLQLLTVPVGAANTIRLDFDRPLATMGGISSGDLSIRGLRYNTQPVLAANGFSHTAGSSFATWTFAANFVADQFLITLSDAVTDASGNHLDGEWKNPKFLTTTSTSVSRFPSGDGAAGGDFAFVFTILPGDATLNNIVNSLDYAQFNMHYGQNGGFIQGDFSGNGIVNYSSDGNILMFNMNRNLIGLAWADFDMSGMVDIADHDLIVSKFGQAVIAWTDGDVNGDGFVDGADISLWQSQFGLELIIAM